MVFLGIRHSPSTRRDVAKTLTTLRSPLARVRFCFMNQRPSSRTRGCLELLASVGRRLYLKRMLLVPQLTMIPGPAGIETLAREGSEGLIRVTLMCFFLNLFGNLVVSF